MGLLNGFIYKIAQKPWEIEAVHALNYRTFAEEIPQHESNCKKRLVDRFHKQNAYIICVNNERKILAGMIVFRDQRPFSLDEKLDKLDSYLPKDRSLCEIRLLAVEEKYRYTRIPQGLIAQLVQHAIGCGHDLALISGNVRQFKLYRFLGFVPFGPMVGPGNAKYQPMYLTLEAYRELISRSRSFSSEIGELPNDDTALFNFLPGPVDFSKQVGEMYHKKPRSHRGASFVRDFQKVRALLMELVNSKYVQILMGPGTLANDAIAGQLSLLGGTGLLLVNGEFGRRLVKNAKGAGLSFYALEIPEEQVFSHSYLEQELNRHPDIGWIWSTHCETSTGVLNDINVYKQFCAEHDIKLCLDCISSIGTVSVDLSGVYLASGTSGKGLASISGLSMVFHHHTLETAPDDLPCILDLGNYQRHDGIPFTIQSNLVYALLAALETQDWKKRFDEIRRWSKNIRRELARINVPVLTPSSFAMPAVVTIPIPKTHSSSAIGDLLESRGVLISYRSGYLLERNWIQVCMMGAEHRPVEKFICLFQKEMAR